MTRRLAVFALITGLVLPVLGDDDDQQKKQQQAAAKLKTTPDPLPEGIQRFNGMLVGRLAKKDIEKGTFVVKVDAVARVWRNSKAEDPTSIVGKYVEVDGVFGKWLDVLLLVKVGETLEFESKHDGGSRLTFPGELLRKVAPYDPGDYPVLPETFRGFNGAVAAKIVKKDPETFEMIIQVDRVIDTWKNNRAKDPKSIEGKKMMLAGFWRRKETYHGLKPGDRIEVGLQHITVRSDHLTVAEFVRKARDGAESSKQDGSAKAATKDGFPLGMRGFRGIMEGQLVSKDVEKGELVIRFQRATRVWRRNEAKDTESCKGESFTVRGISGKFLDTLLTMKPGDKLQVEAFHNGGKHLDFPGELLKKVD